ncbi:nucleotidyltransferase domain-containing protein [Nocardia cyriacigeorgica]|uniref:nucleotidyltransferase domain-containing protein n=1 Tax=Nocardia cyriacigeorgica TaxID=135487 RepID=UPI0002E9A9CF|nr:nucleotidyltransferase [Nocardia cyriacigeorgica]TLF56352.1 nucleotidyltransferase [Nocardia cyriacigeorgica]
MGQTVDGAFAELDEELNLDPAQRERAQERHNAIRDVLEDAGFVHTSFLQGSFARKTMLKPLKDVDIVIVLKAEHWAALSGPEGPQTAMDWFQAPVAKAWPDAKFDHGDKPSAKALRVTFADLDFTIDLVPAFDDDDEFVLIGDRDQKCWEPSNTRRQGRVVSERNQDTKGRFVHQVREMKALVKSNNDLKFIKGIVVESLAFAVIDRKMPDKYAVADVLEHAQTAVLDQVLDPAGDDDVTVKWTSAERQTAASTFASLATQAREALDLEQSDNDAALDVWHALFGDPFPQPDPRDPAVVLADWNGNGGRTSTGRPTASALAIQSIKPGRAWAPR